MIAVQTQPNGPPPQEEPHDVPVYPENDPPPGRETAIKAAGGTREEEPAPRRADPAQPAQPEDVDEDDLDPKVPHSPPDVGQHEGQNKSHSKGETKGDTKDKSQVLFDENKVPS